MLEHAKKCAIQGEKNPHLKISICTIPTKKHLGTSLYNYSLVESHYYINSALVDYNSLRHSCIVLYTKPM